MIIYEKFKIGQPIPRYHNGNKHIELTQTILLADKTIVALYKSTKPKPWWKL